MNSVLIMVFLFLVVYQIKHFLADYLFQGRWMLKKFQEGFGFFLPLTVHTIVHAFMTFWIVRAFTWSSGSWFFCLDMALLDLILHWVMDRLKAGPKYLGRYKPLTEDEFQRCVFVIATDADAPERVAFAEKRIRGNKFFWWSLGFDQMMHHLTHYAVVLITVSRW